MAKKSKNMVRMTTPRVTFGWSNLSTPDTTYADKENPNDLGKYKVRVSLPKDDPRALKLMGELEPMWLQHLEETAAETGKPIKLLKYDADSIPWGDELDKESGDPTGNVVFRFALKARTVSKSGKVYDKRPVVYSSDLKPMVPVPNIGPGTEGRISFDVYPWAAAKVGMSLQLVGVQILKLVERGGSSDPESCGFESEPGCEVGSESGGEGDF